MIAGKMVRIRLRRNFVEQRLGVFIGKVVEFTENWVTVEGKGIIILKGQARLADVDEEPRVIMIPRENIAHIRILPDSFDISEILVEARGFRIYVLVDGAPDTAIGERAED